VVPYRMSYWPKYDFIGEHYWKEKIWLSDKPLAKATPAAAPAAPGAKAPDTKAPAKK
jgi:hypothetical protein